MSFIFIKETFLIFHLSMSLWSLEIGQIDIDIIHVTSKLTAVKIDFLQQ